MGTDGRKLLEYFIIAGLKSGAHELAPLAHEGGNNEVGPVVPITDICVIFPGIGETVPEGYECIETTPLGHTADLNHGSLRAHSAFLCYRRSYHKPPLVDLGILDEGRGEKPMTDSTIIAHTPFGHSANVNNTSHGLYFTTRRSAPNAPPHQLVITHIAVILANKGEVPPHTYYKIDKNLNKGMVGSDVYVCYKKSQLSGKRIAYKPEVLDCFPKVENVEDSLTQNVPMFCLPMGALIESWSDKCREAEKLFSTCVLTDETGTKYYGASLTFYERYDKPLTEAQIELLELRVANGNCGENGDDSASDKASYHCNKSICIVSRYPFFESFRRFLFFIYNVSIAGPYKLPIERYISYLMYEVPFPSPERPRVLVQLANEMISFECHDDGQIPLSGAAFVDSLKNLGSENMMYAMLLALLEQKILVHSLRPWLLTSVAETICALMFPFHWQCPYIPQCPLALAGVLHAPLPFIAGVDSRYFDLYEEPQSDVTCFDLDTATVSHSTLHKSLKLSILPKKPLKKLHASLDAVLKEMNDDMKVSRNVNNGFEQAQQIQNRKGVWEMAIREAFLRFMCSLMAGYTKFLQPIMKSPRDKSATDTGALFNLDGFIRSREKNSMEFSQRFSETQCFNRFIEERCFVSDKNAYNVFFDDCIRRLTYEKATKTETKLLDSDALMSNHTVVIPSPEPSSNATEYRYDHFPEKFQPELFEMDLILNNNGTNLRASSPYSVDNEKLKFWLIRTKQEVKMSLNEAEMLLEENVMSWPNTILFYAYSLWFLQLPSMIQVSRNKLKILKLAFRILCRMERSNVAFHDQVCYRTLIYLCGEYNRPELATQVLLKMTRMGMQLNAVTYGIYHWALMQGDWPSTQRLVAANAWRGIRLRLEAITLFRECGRIGRQQREEAEQQPQLNTTVDNTSSSGHADESSMMATPVTDEETASLPVEESPTRSLKALSISGLTISPRLSSIVYQVRKQALKGYDEMLQQSNVFLKKSGLNLNKSLSNRDISGLSNTSSSFANLNETFGGGVPYSVATNFSLSESTFQLDSGHSGDILGAEFWMREILPQNISEMQKMWLKSSSSSFADISLCSASKCSKCETVIYDEELVAGWTVERSTNLNTNCPHCGFSFLPLLNVSIRRKSDELSSSWYVPLSISVADTSDEMADDDERRHDTGDKVTDFFSVTFISPLVLRRELETLLVGDPLALADVSLRATHPVIFWNLLYYCRRLDVPTHMLTWVAPHVHIRCVYDVPALHSNAVLSPVYFFNHKDALPVAVPEASGVLWQQIIDNLQESNLLKIFQFLLNHHREKTGTAVGLRQHFSFYREILFVALDKFKRSVNRDQFDRQYQQELMKLSLRIQPLLSPQDFPPKANVIACRRIFMPLDVV